MKNYIFVALLLVPFSIWSQYGLESQEYWYLESITVNGDEIPVPVNSEDLEISIQFFFDFDIYVFISESCYSMDGFYSPNQNEFTLKNVFTSPNSSCSLNENSDYSQLYNSLFEENVTYTFNVEEIPNYLELVISHPNGNQLKYRSAFLSIDEEKKISFEIFPNPVSEELRINSKGLEVKTYQIFSLSGQRVLEGMNPGNVIGVSELVQGLYFLEITSEGKKHIQKFIKI